MEHFVVIKRPFVWLWRLLLKPIRVLRVLRSMRRVARYALAATSPEDPILVAIAAETTAMTDEAYMLIGRVKGHLLGMLVHTMRATEILEIGTFTGYSALSMARALPAAGRIVTCEIDPLYANIASQHFEGSPWEKQIHMEVGDALETIASLPGPFDLVLIDADKARLIDYYLAVLPKLAPHGVIVADNTLHEGLRSRVPKTRESIRAVRRFNSFVAQDPQVEQIVLPLPDGLTLIRRVTTGPLA